MAATYQPRLKQKYRTDVIPALQKKFSYGSSMQVPKLQKINIQDSLTLIHVNSNGMRQYITKKLKNTSMYSKLKPYKN